MYSQDDFDRVKSSLDNGTAPDAVKKAYQALESSKYAQLSYEDNPQTKIVRGDVTGTGVEKENYAYAMRDAGCCLSVGFALEGFRATTTTLTPL